MVTERPDDEVVHRSRSGQRGAVLGEVGPAPAVGADADRHDVTGRAGDGARVEIDVEVVFAEAAAD